MSDIDAPSQDAAAPGAWTPKTVTNAQLRARGREYQLCEVCAISTEGGCLRNVRIDLQTARGGMLQQVEMLDYFFCSVACCNAAAQMLIDEINDPSGIESIKTRYGHLQGQVARFHVWSTKVGPSAGTGDADPGVI